MGINNKTIFVDKDNGFYLHTFCVLLVIIYRCLSKILNIDKSQFFNLFIFYFAFI